MKIVTVEEMRRLEEASSSEGISIDTLMENAGMAVAMEARKALGGTVAGSRVLVLVGPGNNGGDGLVAARYLRRWGAEAVAYLLLPRPQSDPKLAQALSLGVAAVSAVEDPDLKALDDRLEHSHLVLDAVLGTGHSRPLEGTVKEVMLHLSAARARYRDLMVMALDLPTGLNADTGEVDAACPGADVTVTLGYPKPGHFQFPGAAKRGRLEMVNIGIPPYMAKDIKAELLTKQCIGEKLPRRPPGAHKGNFGHVLVIAGSRHYVGAAYLASQGASRVGSGLVTLAAPRGIYAMVSSKLTEVIHLPLHEDEGGRIHPDAALVIRENVHQYSSLLVGCGFGRARGLEVFLHRLLITDPQVHSMPVVIDADGLNNLSAIQSWWREVQCPAVLTPHPGEMSTLTGVATADLEARRMDSALEWSQRWGKVVVLKGAHTVIATPQGTCRVSPFANPGLASGGTGDVLTGVIASLMAQGLSPEDAACCGVYLHGAAGEMVREEMGDAGMVASDLLPALPKVIKEVRRDHCSAS